jgi:HEAT repeat protein
MPLPRSFKTDESFLEKIAIGATGTKQVLATLQAQGHHPIELERGSTSFKIWKEIKIKRVRVPDILCLESGIRVESRAKTKLEITMSHSTTSQERGWDFGLTDKDFIAFVHCRRTGDGPLDWEASSLVQYISVQDMRLAWDDNLVKTETPKGAQEGFETRVTWPATIAKSAGLIERVEQSRIQYRRFEDNRLITLSLKRFPDALRLLVTEGDQIQAQHILASVVPVTTTIPHTEKVSAEYYIELMQSPAMSDRYTAAKALATFTDTATQQTLIDRVQNDREHIYVRAESAAGLMRSGNLIGRDFLAATLQASYLEHRLEATIILGEIATSKSISLLTATLQDDQQHPEIRAGAAWSLGEIGTDAALPILIQQFHSLDTVIKIEAARALAKIARLHIEQAIQALPASTPMQRPGIAWALSKTQELNLETIATLLSTKSTTDNAESNDTRHWIAYVLGSQLQNAVLPDIEYLAQADPEVYFAATMLWKVLSSWVYGLEEY